MDIIITGILGLVATVVSGWTSYFFTRKKYNAEVNRDLIDNMKATLDFYKELSDDNSRRLDKILAINEELEKEIAILKLQIVDLTLQVKTYEANQEIRFKGRGKK